MNEAIKKYEEEKLRELKLTNPDEYKKELEKKEKREREYRKKSQVEFWTTVFKVTVLFLLIIFLSGSPIIGFMVIGLYLLKNYLVLDNFFDGNQNSIFLQMYLNQRKYFQQNNENYFNNIKSYFSF